MAFNHKLVSCDFRSKIASFEHVIWKEEYASTNDMAVHEASPVNMGTTKAIQFDFIIGCDGANSVLRHCMMRQLDMDFQQSYMDALWCDFVIPPTSDGQYRLNSQNLHVWPAKDSIIMAQPDFVSIDLSKCTHFRFPADLILGRLFSCGYGRS